MDEIKAKQQVVAKIKESTKILVTVSDSPSVDALSAAIGLTMLLDKQEKYATAIFSGQTPPAIAFLVSSNVFSGSRKAIAGGV
jgi:nanoRNase/pAp phosphatase (c-di-AMP/oligoRNAs hydrolase)